MRWVRIGEIEGLLGNISGQSDPGGGMQVIIVTSFQEGIMNRGKNGNEGESELLRREVAALEEKLKQARNREAEIQEKLALWEDVLSSRGDWYWVVNDRFILTYCSDQVEKITGYSPEEMIGRTPIEFIDPEDRPRFERGAENAIRTPRAFTNIEGRTFTRTGRQIFFLMSGAPFYNTEGIFQGYRGINQDITERKRMESLMGKVRDLALALGSIHDLNEGLSLCLRTALPLSGMDAGGVYLRNDTDGSLRLVVYEGLAPDFIEKVSFFPVESRNNRLLMNGKPIYAHAGEMDALLPDTHFPEGVRLAAVIPILHQGNVIGGFNFVSFTLNDFPPLLPGIVEALIAPIGNAIARLQSEQTIWESEERYRTVISTTVECMWIANMHGIVVDVNDAYCKLTGYAREEIIGQHISEFEVMEDTVAVAEHQKKISENGVDLFETRHRTKKGEIVNLEISTTFSKTEGGLIYAFMRDITARKRAEEALRESESRLRALFAAMNDVVLVVDSEGKYLEFAPSGMKLLYQPAEELQGKTLHEVFSAEQADLFLGSIRETLKKHQPVTMEYSLVIDKEKYWFDATLSPFSGNSVIMVARDITARKRVEEALRESEENYRTLVENSPDIFMRFDREMRHLFTSSSVQKVTGMPAEAFVGKTHHDMGFSPALCEYFEKQIGSVFKTGKEVRDQFSLKGIHGLVIFDWRLVPEFDRDGTVRTVLSISSDITDRKLAEEAREHTLSILQATLESSEDGILVVSITGALSVYNHKLLEIWDIPEEKVIGINDVSLVEYAVARISNPEKFRDSVLKHNEHPDLEDSGVLELLDGRVIEWYSLPQRIGDAVVGRVWSFRDVTLRLRTENALHESVVTLHGVFQAAPVGICFIKDRVVENANEILYETLGCTPEELIRYTTRKFYVTQEEYELVGRELYAQVREKGRGSMETRLKRLNDGTIINTLLTGTLLHADNPSHGYVVTIQDITDRKKAEEALRASERRYREIFDSVPVSIWEYDLNEPLRIFTDNVQVNPGELDDFFDNNPEILDQLISSLHLIDVNRETVLMYGAKNKQEILDFFGNNWIMETREAFRRLAVEYLAGEQRLRIETVNETLDGKKIDVLLQVSFTEEMRRTGRALFAVLNITDRKRAERALRESEERNRKILETTRDGFALLDENGQFVEMNDAFCNMIGYDKEELSALSLSDITTIGDEESLDDFLRILASKGFDRFETHHRHQNGKFIDVEVSVTYLPGEKLFVTFVRDITERKRLEQQLMQAQKMEIVGRLAGGVAHDFNNILTVINASAEVALMFMDPSDQHFEAFEEIKKSGERAADLTRQLLAFSRKQIVEPRVINLNQTLLGMDKMLRRLIGENIELKTIPDDSLLPVKADPGQIEQVITNLVVNARDAMSNGGKLTLETKNVFLDEEYARTHPETIPGQHVMLAVSDTGFGMSEDILSHIFEPFFTTKPIGKGTGLGLSTCYGIVKQHGGGIWIYSEVGRGTMVKVYLPAIEDMSQASISENNHVVLVGGTETVLVVEDDTYIRELVVRQLTAVGYKVLAAANGEEAISIVHKRTEHIHLLITDMVMPLMGGHELADNIVGIQPDIRILFMSGYTDNSIVHHGILQPGVKFIQKPFSMKEFLRKIREVLEEK